jgi:hypothetical protein
MRGHPHPHVTTGNGTADQQHAPASHAVEERNVMATHVPALLLQSLRESTLFGQARCASQVKNRLTRQVTQPIVLVKIFDERARRELMRC